MNETTSSLFEDDHMRLSKLELGPYGTNAYIITCLRTGATALIDAPAEPERILRALEGLKPEVILITHAHSDHYGALARLRSELTVPVAAHPADASDLPVPVQRLLQDGDRIELGALVLRVLHTPGHTPGSICFVTRGILISGDTLFPGGPGRTGSPEDLKRIMESLRRKILPLPADLQVYPGHGLPTVLSREKPLFEAFAARKHDPDLCGDVLWESS